MIEPNLFGMLASLATTRPGATAFPAAGDTTSDSDVSTDTQAVRTLDELVKWMDSDVSRYLDSDKLGPGTSDDLGDSVGQSGPAGSTVPPPRALASPGPASSPLSSRNGSGAVLGQQLGQEQNRTVAARIAGGTRLLNPRLAPHRTESALQYVHRENIALQKRMTGNLSASAPVQNASTPALQGHSVSHGLAGKLVSTSWSPLLPPPPPLPPFPSRRRPAAENYQELSGRVVVTSAGQQG